MKNKTDSIQLDLEIKQNKSLKTSLFFLFQIFKTQINIFHQLQKKKKKETKKQVRVC